MYVRTNSGLGGWGLGDTAATQAQISSIASQYGVDPSLALAVAKQESGYQQTNKAGGTLQSTLANGQPGALGVFQLMPATAAGLGVNPYDQTGNITGGVKYLSQLLQQFNGDVPKALAAYNAGPGAVIKFGGVPPYPETQNYVSSIMANYQPGSAASVDSYPAGTPAVDSSYPTGTGFDFSSLLPSSDSTYNLGGLVLSGSDLLALGAVVVGVLVVSAIL